MVKRIIICLIVIMMFASLLYGCSKGIEEKPVDATSTIAETTVTSTTEPTTEKTTEATTEAEVTTTKPKATITSTSAQKTSKYTATTTKKVTTTQKPTTTKHTTTKKETTTNGCANGNHSMPTGNIGKWFNSRNEVQNYWQQVCNSWATKWENGQISDTEYYSNSPYGYECYSCSSCGKWTGNFKYR